MNVLVINCGSSSLKFQLINAESEEVLAKGLCERIGIDGRLTYQPEGGEKEKSDKTMPTHTEAIQYVIEALTNPETGVVKDLHEIGAVGHRVVHGGEKFASSVIITDEVKKAVEESGIKNGMVAVITKHTTTGIMINEALPCVEKDIELELERLVGGGGGG